MTEAVRYEVKNHIAHIVLDDPNQSANTMNEAYRSGMAVAVDAYLADVAAGVVKGAVVSSAKKTFFAGGDLKLMLKATRDDAKNFFDQIEQIKSVLRKLETAGKPVASAINGAALGGGLEIALATHYRVAARGRYKIGLPEATLGLLPGGGGVVRTVRMLGVVNALANVLLRGSTFGPEEALKHGLVNDVVAPEDLLASAVKWVENNADNEDAATQPWDRKGYKIPGGTPATPSLAAILPSLSSNLRKQLKGADNRAQKSILAVAVESTQVDFDTASRIESRYVIELIVGQQFKNMTQAFFFDMQAINAGRSRPDVPRTKAEKVGIVGAGRMGAGIAYITAQAGIQVVLKDVTLEAAEKGKQYSQQLLDRELERGRITAERRDTVLGLIHATGEYADLKGVDFVVEAVYENPGLKRDVFKELEKVVKLDALLGTNTSTLPITELAEGVASSDNFIGIHFFSPVDKMPLVEIIVGKKTSNTAIARAFDYALAVKKTPIVVGDGRGFFTSRVISAFVNEGVAMLTEGVSPVAIERATTAAGFPTPVLQLTDEGSLDLMVKIRNEAKAACEVDGGTWTPHAAEAVYDDMIADGRPGRLKSAGFYDYLDGKRTGLWDGLAAKFPVQTEQPSFEDLKERMTFIMSIESVRCFDEGVLRTVPDANIGSLLGIGFPAIHGGVIQYINGYEAADNSIGMQAFVKRAQELAEKYGDRFNPPSSLMERASRNEIYS